MGAALATICALDISLIPNNKYTVDVFTYACPKVGNVKFAELFNDNVNDCHRFTDDEDILYAFRSCIGLNGITLAATKPDLLDRSILVELERIPRTVRKTEQEFWTEFEHIRPYLLGGLFDLLSTALRMKDRVQVHPLPRMADFALWGPRRRRRSCARA